MTQYSLQDAQNHLAELIHDAVEGKTILITDEKGIQVQLVPLPTPVKTKTPRPSGTARGLIKMADDFDKD